MSILDASANFICDISIIPTLLFDLLFLFDFSSSESDSESEAEDSSDNKFSTSVFLAPFLAVVFFTSAALAGGFLAVVFFGSGFFARAFLAGSFFTAVFTTFFSLEVFLSSLDSESLEISTSASESSLISVFFGGILSLS